MIAVHDLYKFYGRHRALGPVSFEIEDGCVLGFLGLNGAGKTTTLRILACDLLPSSGRASVDGEDVSEASLALRGRVGFCPERPPLYQEMTVREYLRFAARLRGVPKHGVDGALAEAMGRTQLEPVADKLVGTLSYGFQKRVGIAQAVVHSPRLLILDDPFTGLDPVQIAGMRTMIRELGPRTILLSSHLLGEIQALCDRILVIREGRIVASGSEAELAQRFRAGVRVEVEVRGPRDGVGAVLEGVSGVGAVRCTQEHGEVCTFEVDAASDTREALCRALVEAGFGVRRIDRGERELESIFMELAREPAAGDGEEAA